MPSLVAGATHPGSRAVSVPTSVKTGVYYLIACADDTAAVAEKDEGNNCRASATTVDVRAPDLVVTAISNPPASAAPGGSFGATDTVRNAGNADAPSSMTGYFLSLDAKKSGADILLTGTRAVGALTIGSSSTGGATLTVPPATPPNNYYLIACADSGKKVGESNATGKGETNNCLASTTKVTITP